MHSIFLNGHSFMSTDQSGILISVSSVYQNVNEIKGSSWYDHKIYHPQWVSPERYFLLKKVGRGKYSTVFKALQDKKRDVAIKILVPLDPKRYLREIKILNNLSNGPNIVKLYDLVQDPATGIYSYVFEWVEFQDWRVLYQSFTIDDIRFYMHELLVALDYSHSNGIMHRDIKPQNIAIDKSKKKLRLLDWGLADFYHPRQKYSSHVATRIFKPPELLINYPYYDYSLDIWSAGLTFSIMMFRQIIFASGENDSQQLIKVAEVVGGKKILQYAQDLKMTLDSSTVENLRQCPGTGLSKIIHDTDPELCPPDAYDLLLQMMVVDHRKRITAEDALKHPFFAPLRK